MKETSVQTITWNWKSLFSSAAMQNGLKDENNGRLIQFECDPDGRWAKGTTFSGFTVKAVDVPVTYSEYTADDEPEDEDDWDYYGLYGHHGPRISYSYQKRYLYCNCSQGQMGSYCRHLANLMIHWEKVHGPFVLTETEEEKQQRLKREKEEKERQKREEEARKERERQRLEKEKKLKEIYAADRYLARLCQKVPGGIYFSPDTILKNSRMQTNLYETEQADPLISDSRKVKLTTRIVYKRDDHQKLEAYGDIEGNSVYFLLSRNAIEEIGCSCGRASLGSNYYWNSRPASMCCHSLVAYAALWKILIRDNPGDATSQSADRLLSLLAGASTAEEIVEETMEKEEKLPVLHLTPRITRGKNSDDLELSFDLGRIGEREILVRNLENLTNAVTTEGTFSLSKKVSLDFAKETFDEASQRWYDYILSRVRNVRDVNQRLGGGYYYYTRHLSTGGSVPLKGSDLDILYNLSEGEELLYQFGARNETSHVKVGLANPRIEIFLDPIYGSGKAFLGIKMSGKMPRLLQGNQHQYILDTQQFGRIQENSSDDLLPFRSIADQDGSFTCQIGLRKLAEFYYRVLPGLRSSDQVILHDEVGNLAVMVLPPEPDFVFYLDRGQMLTCHAVVSYGPDEYVIGASENKGQVHVRDLDQENRVESAIRHFFPDYDPDSGIYMSALTDEKLMSVLTDGVAVLSRFGEVKGSEAFHSVQIRPVPQPRVSVEIEGGLLDLSVQTKDMSPEELLDLLAGFHQKKRWFRLKNGDFIDLRDAEKLAELDAFAQDMDISLEELVRHGARLPKYRSLYVDKLLENHEEIASARDRHFKSLVRSFRTIRDSDFEVSAELSDVLRPYQTYGFRWLSTLSQAGFGGILADEMGLGKTVQMLALLQSLIAAGETRPILVACPASLVYNWKDEATRFTPSLKAVTVTGTQAQRNSLLKRIPLETEAVLYITSYDLLKRDITAYDGVFFSTVILDEAQFIKNRNTAAAKAVKVLQAEHRFALTGTPIENRLSELWSIFDFLMPGFLYTSPEFSNRFETPIMKHKDEAATTQLSRMTEPFILRRKKQDVLKDLPEKLEEVQSSVMEKDQRRLYDAQVIHMKEVLSASGDSGEDKMRILAEITRLRQLCCDPYLVFEDYRGSSAKREACLELIQRAMDGGHRMLVFSQFTSMLALLKNDLEKEKIPFYQLTGSTSKEERARLVKAFNEGDVPVFLISLKAGGTGLNLTGADVVIHYDPWWNLAVQNQATDRAHRIGQTRQVTVIKLITANSIEEKIMELQEAKRDLADAIMGGQNNSLMSMSREELLELLS